jgi:hypothetical protein
MLCRVVSAISGSATDYAAEDMFEQDICIERIANPLTVYGDPESVAADSGEWNSAFITETYTDHAFKKKLRQGRPGCPIGKSDTAPTVPTNGAAMGMVRVAEWWKREDVPALLLKLSDGTVIFADKYEELRPILEPMGIVPVQDRQTVTKRVTQYILNGAEVLEKNDWKGKFIPIIPVYGDEVLVEGKRTLVSLVRFSKEPQQMFNYWRTASTELVALSPKAPWVGPKGCV